MLLRRSETAGITAGAISAGRICKWQGSAGASQAAVGVASRSASALHGRLRFFLLFALTARRWRGLLGRCSTSNRLPV